MPRLVAKHIVAYAVAAPLVGGFLTAFLDHSTSVTPWQALISSTVAGLISIFVFGPAGFLFGAVTAIPIKLPIIYWFGNLVGCFSFMYLATKESYFETYGPWLTVCAMLFGCVLTYFIQGRRVEAGRD